MKLIAKIALAKKEIKETKLKKEGRNDFSKYDYFTPSQIEFLVQQVCHSQGILTKFDLVRDSLGVYGVLTIFDTDSEEKLEYQMATAIPEIKATNISQQLGGCMTYTERYLKTSAFGITDNNLDFDSHKPEIKSNLKNEPNVHQEWQDEINKCKKISDLESLYNENKSSIDTTPAIKAMFSKRKAEINVK